MNATTEYPNTRHLACLTVALMALVGLAAAISPPSASAGTYVVSQCRDTLGYQAIPGAQGETNSTPFGFSADCVTDTPTKPGVGVYTDGSTTIAAGAYGAWVWDAPVGAAFKSVDFQSFISEFGTNFDGFQVLAGNGFTCKSYTTAGGWQQVNLGNNGFCSRFGVYLVCGSGGCAPGVAKANVRLLTFELVDQTPPRVGSLTGSLVDGGLARGTETLAVDASDQGSGLYNVTVNANGTVLDQATFACDTNFLKPCPASRSLSFTINTEDLPNGGNTLEVCAVDLSITGAPNRGCETRTVQVDNSCPNSGGSPATVLDAGLQLGGGRLRTELRARSDKAVTVRGTLTGSPSAPGSTVCLYEQVDVPGYERELADTDKVQSDGSFALNVDPGPSRRFDVVYRYNNRTLEHQQLRLDSVVRPRFKIVGDKRLRNGQKVRFRGRLPGPNADGRSVALQADAGKKWRTFKVVKANQKGKFRGLYRFVSTSRTARYVFRARVKRQGGYPYLPGSSRRRDVVVVP